MARYDGRKQHPFLENPFPPRQSALNARFRGPFGKSKRGGLHRAGCGAGGENGGKQKTIEEE